MAAVASLVDVVSEIIVGCSSSAAEPNIYSFGLAVDDGLTSQPIVLTALSLVVVELQSGPQWLAFAVAVADPTNSGRYVIRTTIPAAIANGAERTVRLTVDGVTYGPWVFRWYAP